MAILLESEAASLLSLKVKPGPEDGPVLAWFGFSLTHSTFCIRMSGMELGLVRGRYHPLQRKFPTWLLPSGISWKSVHSTAQDWIRHVGWVWFSQEIYPQCPKQTDALPQWDWDLTKILPCAEPPTGKSSTTPTTVPLLLYLTSFSRCCV